MLIVRDERLVVLVVVFVVFVFQYNLLSFNEIAMRLSARTKVSFTCALSSIYNTLGVVLARQNALAILARRSQFPRVGAHEVLRLSLSASRS